MARLGSSEYIKEIHILTTWEDSERICRGVYGVTVELPQYVADEIYRNDMGVNFFLYKNIKKKHYLQGTYRYMGNIKDNLYRIVFVKKDVDMIEDNVEFLHYRGWYKYKHNWVRYAITDGIRRPQHTHELDRDGIQRCSDVLLEKSRYDRNRNYPDKFLYLYVGKEVDELEKIYAQNEAIFYEAARENGVRKIYVGCDSMRIPEHLEGIGTFDSWLSRFTGRVKGLPGGSGNGLRLQHHSSKVFSPDFCDKSHNPFTERVLKRPIFIDTTFTYRANRRSSEQVVHDIFSHMKDQRGNIEFLDSSSKVPHNATDIYKKYLDVKRDYLLTMSAYLFENEYRVISYIVTKEYESVVFLNASHDKLVRYRMQEGVMSHSDILVDVVADDIELQNFLLDYLYEDATYRQTIIDLLKEVSYIKDANEVIKRLQGA